MRAIGQNRINKARRFIYILIPFTTVDWCKHYPFTKNYKINYCLTHGTLWLYQAVCYRQRTTSDAYCSFAIASRLTSGPQLTKHKYCDTYYCSNLSIVNLPVIKQRASSWALANIPQCFDQCSLWDVNAYVPRGKIPALEKIWGTLHLTNTLSVPETCYLGPFPILSIKLAGFATCHVTSELSPTIPDCSTSIQRITNPFCHLGTNSNSQMCRIALPHNWIILIPDSHILFILKITRYIFHVKNQVNEKATKTT